jgi:hypothetical protein
MPDIINSNIDKQVYAVEKKGNLLAQVDKVFVCLSDKSLQVAGFNSSGEVLTIRSYPHDQTPDFFGSCFTNEPLLTNTGKVSHVFVTARKNLLVPRSLYKEDSAAQWFNDVNFISRDEFVYDYQLKDDKAYYLYAISQVTKEVIERYFPKAKVLPFAAHQFNKGYKTPQILQCSFTSNEVFLTLYKDRKLHWHKVIAYETIEDIAYEIKLLSRQQDLDEEQLAIICAAENNTLTRRIHDLYSYFPQLKIGTGKIEVEDGQWKAPVYLFQQLYTCV